MGEAKRKSKARREKTTHEIESHFKEQWNMLVSSCLAFDAGDTWEAPRIANAISTFCSDRGQFSLFTLIEFPKLYSSVVFDTSYKIDGRNLLNDHSLVGMQLDSNGARYINFLDDTAEKKWTKFDSWWARDHIVRFAIDDFRLTRSELVLIVRDKEGGSHVDKDLHETLARIEEELDRGWIATQNGQEASISGSILIGSIRQIAHELLRTIQAHGRNLIADAKQYPSNLSPTTFII